MGKRSEFIGFRDDIIHGQPVTVKVYDYVGEPTIDWERMINRAMEATPCEVTAIWDDIIEYKTRQVEWDSLDFFDELPSPTVQSRDMWDEIPDYEDVTDIPLDADDELVPIDDILGGNYGLRDV